MLRRHAPLALLLIAISPACDGPSSHGTAEPSHRTYPPSPSGDDVDAFGGAKDPKISACMAKLDNQRGMTATFLGSSEIGKPNKSDDWKMCWCNTRGYSGALRSDGSCK